MTALTLFVLAGLHLAWGRGSSFPYMTRDELADAVVGTDAMPSSTACVTVAVLLSLAAAMVGRVLPLPRRLRTVALRTVTAVLSTRGVVGAMGRTSMISPGSVSPAFVRLDRRLYSPLCLWLAAGVRRSI